MIEVVDFKAEHLEFIKENGMQDTKLKPFFLPEHSIAMEKLGGVYSILESGIPVAVGGIVKYWENRGEAWLIFGKPKTKNFIFIFRHVKRFLEFSKKEFKRIEMVVKYDFEQGHRWARLLGFSKEGDRLKSYTHSSEDVTLYAMVRE